MKLKSVTLAMNSETFGPELEMTIIIPLDPVAGLAGLTEDDLSLKLGRQLLDLIKTNKLQNI